MKNRYNIKEPLILNSLRFFIENPYLEIYLREYSRRLSISINSAQRFLDYFLNEGLILEFKRGNLRYFKANLSSLTFKHIKITFSLKKLEDSGLISYIRNKDSSNLILFGSKAKGEDDRDSDWDLLAIGSKKEETYEAASRFERDLGRINIHYFSWNDWIKSSEKNKAFYQEVIATGICLIGEMPIVR